MSMTGTDKSTCPVGMHVVQHTEGQHYILGNTGVAYETDVSPVLVTTDSDGNMYINNKPIRYDAERCYWASEEEFKYLKKALEAEAEIDRLEKKLEAFNIHRDYAYETFSQGIIENPKLIDPDIVHNRLELLDYINRIDDRLLAIERCRSNIVNKFNRYNRLAQQVRGTSK